MEQTPYFDIIVFALLAGFIFYKLRSVLGKEDGTEQKIVELRAQQSAAAMAHRDVSGEEQEEADDLSLLQKESLKSQLAAIHKIDTQFLLQDFVTGAKAAFEMALKAYSERDKHTLRSLLSKDVFAAFEQNIEEQEAEKRFQSITLISILSAEVTDIAVERNIASITVAFTSEEIRVVKDAEGEIVEGDAEDVDVMTDSWTFERNLRSSDPNWTITAT